MQGGLYYVFKLSFWEFIGGFEKRVMNKNYFKENVYNDQRQKSLELKDMVQVVIERVRE